MNEIERENQKLAAAASILYAGGISQRAISAKLGIEQSRVSRLLHRAEKEFGWIQIAPQVIKDRMPAEVLADAELLAHEDQDFEQLLGAWSPYGRCRASVIYSGGEEKLFYRLTADIFGRLLVNCQSVGVLYGRTLWQMVSLLDQQKEPGHSPLHRLRHIDFVPLCGEPINLMFEAEQPPSHSASHIAEAMQRLAGHQTQGLIASLSGIHAYIKRGDQRGLIQDYFQSTAAFKKIFSEPSGLVHKVNAIVTGVGAFTGKNENEMGGLMRERTYQESNLSREHLEHMVYGDIGGILLPRIGIPQEQISEVNALNEGWLGLREAHLRACAKRAKSNVPGVVVISQDARRAEVIREAIRRGLVNQVIVDDHLRDALKGLGER